MLKNKDIFTFDFLEDQTNQHGKNAVSINLILKLDNLKFYQEELEKDLEEIEPIYQKILDNTKKFLNFKKFHQSFEANQSLEKIKDNFNTIIEIFNHHIEALPEKIQLILEEINIELIKESIDNKKLEKNISQAIDSFEFFLERVKKTYDGIEKLDNKKLKCIVRFSINSFETNFTKYYLNLEEYGDVLNGILQSQIKKLFFKKYKKLEKDFLASSDVLNSPAKIKVKDLLSISQNLLDKLKTIEELNVFLLNAQKRYESIKYNYESSLDILEEINEKYIDIFNIIKNETNDLQDAFNAIYFFENINLDKFLDLNEEKVKNCIPFLKKAEVKKHSQQILLLPIIEFFDSELAKDIKTKILNEAANQKGFSNASSQSGYFLKKATRQVYTNNRFYSHEISEYKFFEEENFRNHKYSHKFIDKVSTSKSIKLFSGVVKSKFFKKELMYQTYIIFKDSKLNLKNYDEVINRAS